MTDKDFKWLQERPHLLGNVRMTRPELVMITDIYNRVTGENKPLTSCGRCVLNIKKRLKIEVNNYEKRNNSN